jgi:hypothetical protein
MANATPQSLTEPEWLLVRETRRDNLKTLDEDGLVELHGRVRRARDKHVKVHRRQGARQVGAKGARTATVAPRRSASKAEIFEDALARVSAALAKAARQSAAELRAERLAAARRAPSTPPTKGRSSTKKGAPKSRSAARSKRPVEKKTAASTKAQGARRQAARDAR